MRLFGFKRARDGRYAHPLYAIWAGMLSRCYNHECNRFKYYGQRGIQVCDRWRADFWAFATDMGPRPDQHSLDRINNDGNYEPSNCRWAKTVEQNRNRRRWSKRAAA